MASASRRRASVAGVRLAAAAASASAQRPTAAVVMSVVVMGSMIPARRPVSQPPALGPSGTRGPCHGLSAQIQVRAVPVRNTQDAGEVSIVQHVATCALGRRFPACGLQQVTGGDVDERVHAGVACGPALHQADEPLADLALQRVTDGLTKLRGAVDELSEPDGVSGVHRASVLFRRWAMFARSVVRASTSSARPTAAVTRSSCVPMVVVSVLTTWFLVVALAWSTRASRRSAWSLVTTMLSVSGM